MQIKPLDHIAVRISPTMKWKYPECQLVILGEIRNNISASIFIFKDDNISRVNFAIIVEAKYLYTDLQPGLPSCGLDQYYLYKPWHGQVQKQYLSNFAESACCYFAVCTSNRSLSDSWGKQGKTCLSMYGKWLKFL